ncbi:MAG: ribose 5-phosphate isomerase B [Erysipelotrichaceae bacterium]
METKRLRWEDFTAICDILAQGGVVAFPTDTVYGLGCIYEEEALAKLKRAKGRPESKPIPTMVANLDQLRQIAHLPPRFLRMAEQFMPGALTLVLRKKDGVPGFVTNEMDTIGIRIPAHPDLQQVMAAIGKPLLVTSANLSDYPTGRSAQEVLAQLDGRIDAIVEGTPGGDLASTIVDTTQQGLTILRPGKLSVEQLEEVLGMNIAIGCDHGGLEYKNMIVKMLEEAGHHVMDMGTYTHASVDYVDHATLVCQAVQKQEAQRGIVICGTGIGMSIAANKHAGIRCALVSDLFTARVTREHNDSNVLALGQRVLGEEIAKEIVRVWLASDYSHEPRHDQRIQKIAALED